MRRAKRLGVISSPLAASDLQHNSYSKNLSCTLGLSNKQLRTRNLVLRDQCCIPGSVISFIPSCGQGT